MADLNAQTSPLTITARMGAATADPCLLPSLSLNRYGLYSQFPVLELSGDETLNHGSLFMEEGAVLNLSALELEANTDTNLDSIEGGMNLPGLTIDMSMGFEVSSKFPVIELSASGSFVQFLNLSGKLSTPSLVASTGLRCGTLTLPEIRLSTVISGDLIGRLDKTMPGLSLDATGGPDITGTLSCNIPTLTISAAGTGAVHGDLSAKSSTLKISATASLNDYGTLDEDLPSLIISAGTSHQSSMSLDAKIATLLTSIVGSGAIGSGSGSFAANTSRFTDYVLRHSR